MLLIKIGSTEEGSVRLSEVQSEEASRASGIWVVFRPRGEPVKKVGRVSQAEGAARRCESSWCVLRAHGEKRLVSLGPKVKVGSRTG